MTNNKTFIIAASASLIIHVLVIFPLLSRDATISVALENGANTPELNFIYLDPVRSVTTTKLLKVDNATETVTIPMEVASSVEPTEQGPQIVQNKPRIALQSTYSAKSDTPTSPSVRYNPAPIYPLLARQKGMEGIVRLTIQVREDGQAEEVRIKESSGFKPLDEAALKSVKNWVFTPAYIAGQSVSARLEIPIEFRLSDI